MSLKDTIQEDMKTALKTGDKQRLGTIRLLMAAIKQREVDSQITLDDSQVLAVIEKMVKQRRDAMSQFAQAGRQDLVDKEQTELNTLQSYLPEQLSEEEIAALVKETINATGASSMKDMGIVMGKLKPKLQGKADMSAVSAKVKEMLQ